MRRLLHLCLIIWRPHWSRLCVGALSAISVAAMGIALIGVSGWFITAAGLAGIAGAGVAFDVFRPSAAIRFLAFGRAATRYGERLAVHDATFRGLTELRSKMLATASQAPIRKLQALHAPERLNRLTADVDALDGIASRLIVPLLAAVVLLPSAPAAIWYMVAAQVAMAQLAGFVFGVITAFAVTWSLGRVPIRRAQHALQALRLRFIEGMRGQSELVMAGRMKNHVAHVLAAQDRLQHAQRQADLTERLGAFAITFGGAAATAASLWFGMTLVQNGSMSLPMAAAGFFVSLGLAEILGPLARSVQELTRGVNAARRVSITMSEAVSSGGKTATVDAAAGAPVLGFEDVGFSEDGRQIVSGLSFSLRTGESVALVGPSGIGKSTVLLIALGQLTPERGCVSLHGRDLSTLAEQAIFAQASLLPQRSALMSGTVMDALRLADPQLSEDDAWKVLDAVRLGDVLKAKGGLKYFLSEGGAGLSGGEQRRLALARVLLRRPRLLLLDEPTEGLDADTARQVLDGVRAYLAPDATVLLASHSEAEKDWCGRQISLEGTTGGDRGTALATLTDVNAAPFKGL